MCGQIVGRLSLRSLALVLISSGFDDHDVFFIGLGEEAGETTLTTSPVVRGEGRGKEGKRGGQLKRKKANKMPL